MAVDTSNSPVHWLEGVIAAGSAIAPGAAVTSLTDNTGGTASDTLADVPGAYTEATLANQLASLAAKINTIITRLRTVGIIST